MAIFNMVEQQLSQTEPAYDGNCQRTNKRKLKLETVAVRTKHEKVMSQ